MVISEVSEWHELDNISAHVLLILPGVKWLIVGIQNIHAVKISLPNANDHDGEGKVSPPNNLVDSLLHITDDSIRNDQQDLILLVVLGYLHGLSSPIDSVYDIGEVCWAVQLDVSDGPLVTVHDPVDPFALWIKDVSVESEAVARGIVDGGNYCSKSVSW
eukprot:CAMPEP_0168619926 /NCGR_PEP_ID=MMETSP0449_2-20121227/6860_1 /TAXON_ID=1082188 /ORGANISM="Strombidium rassoulzadegani, Strain ras09" /LENGTH=159 /DNA_ID=CAMNT_0008660889 /DNA_START=478 /DNA_END=954 /DNA_ORIENTATION=+